MDVAKMRQVLAIRQYGSFAKAAHSLGMAQPSLSQSISRLEDQMKVKIFDRSAVGSRLTPIGEVIVERARRVITEMEWLVRDTELLAGGEAGHVRLGFSTSLRTIFLPRLLRSIVDDYPKLRIHAETNDADDLLPMLKSRELDLVICAMTGNDPDQRLVVLDTLRARGVAVASPEHPLALQNTISRKQFVQFVSCSSVVPTISNTTLLQLDDGEEGDVAFYTANDYASLLPLVISGHTTLLAPYFVLQPMIESGELKVLKLDWTFDYRVSVMTTQANSLSPILNKIAAKACAISEGLQAEWDACARRLDLGL